MKTREEIAGGCAEILRRMRLKKGLSKAKLAGLCGIDEHTLARYENGESSPSVPDFIYILAQLDENPLRPVLDFLYPETFEGLTSESEIAELRRAAVYYFDAIAGERALREFNYFAFGRHGSSFPAQLNEITIIDHLPLEYRYAIAELVGTLWRLAEERGELVNPDEAPPDVNTFYEAIESGRRAVIDGGKAYNTIYRRK